MQTAKKQKMNRDELSLYEHEEVRSWRTENEEGADLNLIVVNNEKKSTVVPCKIIFDNATGVSNGNRCVVLGISM